MDIMNKISRGVENPWKIFSALARHGWFDFMSDEKFLYFMYRSQYKDKPNMQNPTLLNEKMMWLKIHDHNPIYTDYVDKEKVKEIVGSKIGFEHIIPTLGVWDSFNDIDFSLLPSKFVLKCTHDSGSIVICKNKDVFDKKKAENIINKGLKRDFYKFNREWPYKNVKHRIIAEELLEESGENGLIDYKFYCYGGKPVYFMYSIGEASHNARNRKYDMSGKSIDHLFKRSSSVSEEEVNLPDNLEEMVDIVNQLCKDFPHVRIDLYNVKGKIYFGEVTFYSNGGYINIASQDYSQYLADMIQINQKQ